MKGGVRSTGLMSMDRSKFSQHDKHKLYLVLFTSVMLVIIAVILTLILAVIIISIIIIISISGIIITTLLQVVLVLELSDGQYGLLAKAVSFLIVSFLGFSTSFYISAGHPRHKHHEVHKASH